MAEEEKPQENTPLAGQPSAPAYWAMDYYFDNLRKVVASAPSGGTEFGEQIKNDAVKNLSATREFMKKLSQAKSFQDLVRLQSEFMRSQVEAIVEQTQSLTEALTKIGK